MDDLLLYKKLSALPENLKSEVANFIDFLSKRNRKKKQKPKPKFGSGKNMFVMKPGFDEPLEDFKDYIE